MTSYSDAGVDLEGAERHVARISASVTSTWGAGVIGGFGGFAAGIEIPRNLRRPVLMLSTDGVGTKIEIARATGNWGGVGQDLVAMCADDLVAVGARPIAFVDYLAVGSLDAERDAEIVASVADACGSIGMALIGGETAEHPGVMEPGQVDLAGTAAGLVEKGQELTGDRISEGDLVIGLRSPNLRSNGFSLVRKVFEGIDLARDVGGRPLGEALLEPSVLYAPAVLDAVATGAVHGAAHITGGGIPGNLERPLPDQYRVEVDWSAWERPGVFDLVAEAGGVDEDSMRRTFNLGIGFCLYVDPSRSDEVLDATRLHQPTVIGRVHSS